MKLPENQKEQMTGGLKPFVVDVKYVTSVRHYEFVEYIYFLRLIHSHPHYPALKAMFCNCESL